MIRKYSDCLPEYLDGPNIRAHSSVLEEADRELYNKIVVLRDWNKLERPILFERVWFGTAFIAVHICTPAPIRKITLEWEDTADHFVTETYEYAEDDLTTEVTIQKNYRTNDRERYRFDCTVETYDDTTYTKKYPENDTIQNNSADHDIFLDKIGALLGVPRRTYKKIEEWDPTVFTYPLMWFKVDDEGNLYAGTEDDWYYRERLYYFITHRTDVPLTELMLMVLFQYEPRWISRYLLRERETSLTDEYNNYYTLIVLPLLHSANIDNSNLAQQIQKYDILTRPTLIKKPEEPTLTVYNQESSMPVNNYRILYEFETEEGLFIDNSEILLQDSMSQPQYIEIVHTDKNVTDSETGHHVFQFLPSLLLPDGSLYYKFPGDYEFLGIDGEVPVGVSGVCDMTFDAWRYGQRDTASVNYVPAFTNSNDELCVGRVCVLHTPVIHQSISLDEYYVCVNFKYNHGNDRLGIGYIQPTEDGKYTIDTDRWISPTTILGAGNINDTHTLVARFIDGIMTYTLDGVSVEGSWDMSSRDDILYIFAYSNHEITGENVLTIVDCTVSNHPIPIEIVADTSATSTEWTNTPQNDGVHATSSYEAWKTKIPAQSTLQITANITGGAEFDLRDSITGNSSSLSFKSTGITKWGQVGSGTISTTDKVPTGTGVTVELTNTGTGVFTYEYSDGTTGTVNLGSNKLDTYYLAFKNGGSGEVVITDLRYNNN